MSNVLSKSKLKQVHMIIIIKYLGNLKELLGYKYENVLTVCIKKCPIYYLLGIHGCWF